jgi:hypothetical protein
MSKKIFEIKERKKGNKAGKNLLSRKTKTKYRMNVQQFSLQTMIFHFRQ